MAGLGAACREYLANRDDQVFQKARGATGQLGLRVQGFDDERNRQYLEGNRDDAKAAGVEDMSVEQAVRAIEAAVQRAFPWAYGWFGI